MQIITRRSDPTHRVAFGTRAAAEGFIAEATDPADWALDDPPDHVASAPAATQQDPADPR